MHKATLSVLVLSLLSVSSAVFAAGQMKPGLWEMSMKSDMMKNMPKMSPEQMEQMKKMGVNIPQMQDGAMVTKVCISKEMAEREHPPQMARKESGCEMKNFQRSGTSYSMDMVCDSQNMKGTGTIKGNFSNNESYNSTYDFKGTAHGQPVDQHHESSGKWLAADCGTIKPMNEMMPPKK